MNCTGILPDNSIVVDAGWLSVDNPTIHPTVTKYSLVIWGSQGRSVERQSWFDGYHA